ncbi:MAG: SCO family protein [Gammaproteobacteria bacterium]|nr:SCO family protein [Gammaproteobacteria bacterium]
MQRLFIFFITAMSLVLIAVFVMRPVNEPVSGLPRVIAGEAGSLLLSAKPLPEFMLMDQDGDSFGNQQLQGHWTLLFMGFSSCSHFCPPTMYKLGLLRDELDAELLAYDDASIEVLFVSVDPGRDSLLVLNEYITAYGAGFTAITGEQQQLDTLVEGLDATYSVNADPDDYRVDHSPTVYLLNPEGVLVALFTPPHRVEYMAADVRTVVAGL